MKLDGIFPYTGILLIYDIKCFFSLMPDKATISRDNRTKY